MIAPACVDMPSARANALANGIEHLYAGTLDVMVVRGAIAGERLAAVAGSLDRGETNPGWSRPNAAMAAEDIQVLGLAATPTYSTPTGPTLDAYLNVAGWYDENRIFGPDFNPTAEITRALARLAGGRPVEVLHATDSRGFAPFTVRRLVEGKGIGLHHDLHTSLPMFKDIAPLLDTRTLISYVVTLQGPEAGGELCVYNLSPTTPDPPKMANGFTWDLPAVEARFDPMRIATGPGDLFLFASARCLHRVSPVVGPRARFTMGGFLALSNDGSRVLYWS